MCQGRLDSFSYLRALAELRQVTLPEIEANSELGKAEDRISLKLPFCVLASAWYKMLGQYEKVLQSYSLSSQESINIAEKYDSMEQFWQDAALQSTGDSDKSFWDVYENGARRQLENTWSKKTGAPQSLFVNSGMSCVAVFLGAMKICSGQRVLTTFRNYFETSDYLESFVAPLGIEIVRRDLYSSDLLNAAIREVNPDAILFETVSNEPSVQPMPDIFNHSIQLNCPILIDNTVQGANTRFEFSEYEAQNLVVFESTAKYLNHRVMGGVLYGHDPVLNLCRHYARSTGQQMQGRIVAEFNAAEIELLTYRMQIHAANVDIFSSIIEDGLPSLKYLRTLSNQSQGSYIGRNKSLAGCLIFIAFEESVLTSAIFSKWVAKIRSEMLQVDIRAGFGWNITTARVYGEDHLNQKDGSIFIRISLGIEPKVIVERLAELFVEATDDVTKMHA